MQLCRAEASSSLQGELEQARAEQAELKQKVESLEEEAQEQYDACTAKEQVRFHWRTGITLSLSIFCIIHSIECIELGKTASKLG